MHNPTTTTAQDSNIDAAAAALANAHLALTIALQLAQGSQYAQELGALADSVDALGNRMDVRN